eukprot:1354081-Rhodomonas_salina.1
MLCRRHTSSSIDMLSSATRWRSKDQRRKLVRKAMSEVYRMQIRDPTLLRTQPLQPRSAFPPKIDTGCLTDGQATISRQPSGAVATRIENRHDAAPQDADSCFKSGLELQQRGNVRFHETERRKQTQQQTQRHINTPEEDTFCDKLCSIMMTTGMTQCTGSSKSALA